MATVGTVETARFAFTTRAMTSTELATFIESGTLPAGIGTETGFSTVKAEYRAPGSGTVVVPSPTKDATGAFHFSLHGTSAGEWLYRGLAYNAGGEVIAATEWIPVSFTASTGSSGTVGELVANVLSEASFDATEAQALQWLSRKHELMVVRAKCFRQKIQIGPTVSEQAQYAVPARVVEIRELKVANVPYGTGKHRDIAENELGYIWLDGIYVAAGGGLEVRDYDESGNSLVTLVPTPTEAGLEVTLSAVCRPEPLVIGQAGVRIPPEFYDALVAGAVATGLQRLESRPDLAQSNEAIFTAGCLELLRQTNQRYRGSGPAQIRVVGLNA